MIPDPLLSDLRARFGDRFSTAAAVRDHHSRAESHHAPVMPDAVVFPVSTEEVQAVVRACAPYKVPMTAFGA